MSQIYTFFFNGREYYTKQPITLIDLISYFNYNSSLFVLEYNNFICNKNEWNKITVKNKDKIEIVTIVGGG
uniref:Thiamine biosynthesis protein n=1 Tax=Hemiaulus sinensis TaxID=1003062 RepID=UPI002238F10D|nr:Thiamine biosynthesis protein [Hemiaulus sinensis]UYC31045.1 Thiamine biosynthesis protein [Hemiaulus sinensis]